MEFAKIFDFEGQEDEEKQQLLVTKEYSEDGEDQVSIVFETDVGGYRVSMETEFNTNQAANEYFDGVTRDTAGEALQYMKDHMDDEVNPSNN